MATIAETAAEYETAQTKNIAELERVSVHLNVVKKTFKEGTDDEFSINTVNVDGVDYRIPTSVLATLKDIMSLKPELQYFKVTKTGSGLQTKYSVIPL